MESIKLEITEEDIRTYIEKNKERYQDREAMFVKYMKENKITKEAVEIIVEKYNWQNFFTTDTYPYVSKEVVKEDTLPNFESYITGIHHLDISGICHILIPTMKYYGKRKFHVNQLYVNLDLMANNLMVPMNSPLEVMDSTLDDYRICRKVEIENKMLHITMNREACRKELLVYQDYYEETKVKRIKKMIRER